MSTAIFVQKWWKCLKFEYPLLSRAWSTFPKQQFVIKPISFYTLIIQHLGHLWYQKTFWPEIDWKHNAMIENNTRYLFTNFIIIQRKPFCFYIHTNSSNFLQGVWYCVIPFDYVWCVVMSLCLTTLYFWLIITLSKKVVMLWNLVRVKTIFVSKSSFTFSGNISLPVGLPVSRVRVKDLSTVEPITEHETK